MTCDYIGPDAPSGCETEAIWLIRYDPRVAGGENKSCDAHIAHFLRRGVNLVRAIN